MQKIFTLANGIHPEFSINTDREHPFSFHLPAIRFARQVALNVEVTIFVGDNGTGKSTLLETLACRLHVPLIGGFMGDSKSFVAAKILKPFVTLDWQGETAKGFFFRAGDFSHFVDGVERERMKHDVDLPDLRGKVEGSIIEQMNGSMNYPLHRRHIQGDR